MNCKDLITEIGKLCMIVELLPLQEELDKGVHDKCGNATADSDNVVLPDIVVEKEGVDQEELHLGDGGETDIVVNTAQMELAALEGTAHLA